MKRPLTPEELAEAQRRGYDTSNYAGQEIDFPDAPLTSTALGAGSRAAASAAIPTLAGGAGFAGGMALGTAAAGALAIPSGGLSLAIPLIMGAAGGYGAAKLAGAAQEAVIPTSWEQRLHTDVQEHPTATTVGHLTTLPLGGFNLSPKNVALAARGIPQLLGGSIGAAERQALINTTAGAGIGAAQEATIAGLEGRPITPANLLMAAGIGGTFTKPNAIGRGLGFHNVPERSIDNSELLRAMQARDAQQPLPEPEVYRPAQRPPTLSILDQIQQATGAGQKLGKKAENSAEAMATAMLKQSEPVAREGEEIVELKKAIDAKIAKALEKKATIPPVQTVVDVTPVEQYKAPEPITTPLQQEVTKKLGEQELSTDPSAQYTDTIVNELLQERGIKVTPDEHLMSSEGQPLKGNTILGKEGTDVLYNPNKQTIDTLPHEGMHDVRLGLELNAGKGDKAAQQLLSKWDTLSAKGLEEFNAARIAKGLKPVDAHEFSVSEQGYEFVKRQLNLDREGTWKRWWEDTKSLLKTRYSDNLTLPELRRAINFRYVNEPRFGRINDLSAIPKGIARAQEVDPEYAALLEKMKAVKPGTPEFNELWGQLEEVKNTKAAGLVPPKEKNQPEGEGLTLDKLTDKVNKEFEEREALESMTTPEHVKLAKQVDSLHWQLRDKKDHSRNQGEGEGLFTTKAEKILKKPRENKLTVSGAGTLQGTQMLNSLKNQLHPTEWEVLKQSGIEKEFTGRVAKPEEVLKWVKENGPRVEVRKFGEGEQSPEVKRFNEISHQLDTHPERALLKAYLFDGYDGALAKLTPEGKSLALEYEKLNKPYTQEGENKAHWADLVAPKHVKDMPGYTEIAVVKPSRKMAKGADTKEASGYQQDEKGNLWAMEKEQFPSSHSFPPNTLAFTRGYMETLPNGKKVWHVVEVQSDWAQKVKQEKETFKDNPEYLKKHPDDNIDDPLLAHYNRLALKAAIEHAREQGADYVAVQDAESAMMTEGHDKVTQAITPVTKDQVWHAVRNDDNPDAVLKEWYGNDWEQGMYVKFSEATRPLRIDKIENNQGEQLQQMAREAAPYAQEGTKLIPQEKGMRLNYDSILPKIAEELTGSKGEKVSFGEHKMAFDYMGEYEEGQGYYKTPRKNLIFRNPDNTSKTDVSGIMYPLEKVSAKLESGDNFTLFNKHQPIDEGLPTDQSRKGFLRPLESAADKLERVSIPHAEAIRRWGKRRDELLGLRNTTLEDLKKYDTDVVNEVVKKHREAYREGKEPTFTMEEKPASELLSKYFSKIADIREQSGLKINERTPGKNKWYVPDQLNDKSLELLTNRPNSPEAHSLQREWAEHVVKESEGTVKFDQALEDIKEYSRALRGGDQNYLSVNFGAIRKAAGFGLPEAMREGDYTRMLAKYGNRAAKDLAMFLELESKPEIAGPLRLINPSTGKAEKTGPDISITPEAVNAMKWITGNMAGQTSQTAPKINALTRLVNNSILGAATGIRDTATIPLNSIPYLNRFADLDAFFKGVANIREHSRAALETAARQPSIDRIQFNELLDAPDRFTAVVGKAANFMRKVQGREAIENFNRDLTFSIGKELAYSNILGAKAGDKRAKMFLEKFDTLVDKDVTKLTGPALEKAVNQIAKNFTDRNQGTYGAEGLPTGIVDSQFAPFFALQKWSVEKSNVIYKDVVKPFITGENRLPMLTYMFGTLLTGAAIQQLNELLTGRKSQDPTVKEALAKGDAASMVSELATIMQLASFAGIVGDLTKAASDIGVRGKTPRNIVSFPTATAAVDLGESTTDMLEALRQGESAWDVMKMYALDLVTHNVQTARMVANHTVKDGELERSDKFRDRRVFNELEGKPAGDMPRSNKYLGIDEREFKRSSDPTSALSQLPSLVERQIEKGNNNYPQIQRNLRGLKSNSYQIMPDPLKDPVGFQEYYSYLIETQGEGAAKQRMEDYLQQSMINRIKSSVIPSL